jgi:Flp pilus assembly protein TadD
MPTFDADHYLAVAASYFDNGAFARCVEACRRGVAEHPADARLWDRLGVAAWALDDWPAVAGALEAAGRLTPLRPLARLALADAYLALDRRADAVRELTALAEPGACDAEMLANAAGRLFRAGEYRRAERAWRRVLRRRPRWAEAHYHLAACLWRRTRTRRCCSCRCTRRPCSTRPSRSTPSPWPTPGWTPAARATRPRCWSRSIRAG